MAPPSHKPVRSSPAPQGKPSSTISTTNIASTLLHRAHSSAVASQIFTERVVQRPLHIKPSSPPPPSAADIERATRRAERRRKELEGRRGRRRARKEGRGPLTAREKRALGVHCVPRKGVKYTTFEPLHELWCAYVREVLGLEPGTGKAMGRINPLDAANKLTSADYHGALVTVVRSRCVSRVGVHGIVIKDSKGTFEVVTRDNAVKVVPKEHTIFKVEVQLGSKTSVPAADAGDGYEAAEELSKENSGDERKLIFELRGDQFQFRAADRANRKFKAHYIADL